MHHYPFNIGDYRKDTSHLSILEHGIYRLLIDTYYLLERPLSLDHRELARLHCARSEEERQALENVLSDFFTKTDDGYIHNGCQKVLEKIYEKSDKARQSAQRKWEIEKAKKCERTESQCDSNANASNNYANASKNDANDMLPITHNPIPITHNPIFAQCADAPSPVGMLPTNVSGKNFPVYGNDLLIWEEAYPAVDILAEMRKIKAWLVSNPKNRKTSGGMKRFINSWLSRAQDNHRISINNQQQRQSLKDFVFDDDFTF